VPKLIGCYESELHPHLERALSRGHGAIVNLGSAEGYYAVGLARRAVQTRVYAYDTDDSAQRACRKLADLNAVAERVDVGGEFRPIDFARFTHQRTLVVCDIEGGEAELLDPEAAPALRDMDLIVELHETARPGVTELLRQRFAASHDAKWVPNATSTPDLPRFFFERLTELDRLIAVWEWRISETPWLVLTRR